MESIPLTELPSLTKDIYANTRETSRNTDIDMQELLEIDKIFQATQHELVNDASKLTETNKNIKKDGKK